MIYSHSDTRHTKQKTLTIHSGACPPPSPHSSRPKSRAVRQARDAKEGHARHLLCDPHVEVVEVAIATVGLPGVLAAVGVLAEDGDGVERVGLSVVVAHACHGKVV